MVCLVMARSYDRAKAVVCFRDSLRRGSSKGGDVLRFLALRALANTHTGAMRHRDAKMWSRGLLCSAMALVPRDGDGVAGCGWEWWRWLKLALGCGQQCKREKEPMEREEGRQIPVPGLNWQAELASDVIKNSKNITNVFSLVINM